MNPFSFRRYIIAGIFVMIALIYISRLFYIQVIDNKYKLSAQGNAYHPIRLFPARGLIFDRNGKLLVCNQAAFDLMYNPIDVGEFDTAKLSNIIGITKDQLVERFKKNKKSADYSKYIDQLLLSQLSDKTYAMLQERLYQFPGFYVQERTLRHYQYPIAAHLFGYVGEVDTAQIKKNPYYQLGDYIGISGIEKAYEKQLRGSKGVKIFLRDVHNRIKGPLNNGAFDTAAVIGKNVTCTIDASLQQYAEKLLKPFHGAIVAIEPSSGEILAIVSSPNYDPQLLVGQERKKKFLMLQNSPILPLYNRALAASYPPGSTFKLINALIGLQEQVITQSTQFSCYLGWTLGSIHIACHPHPSPLDLKGSIQNSCNSYYCNVFRKIVDNPKYSTFFDGYQVWRNYVLSFGIGSYLNSDLLDEGRGNVPSVKYYDKYYGKSRWHSSTVISLAIGQGELGVTPLHMANIAAIIANKGYYYIPHVVKQIEGQDTISSRFQQKKYTNIDSSFFNIIIEGMELAVSSGTASGGNLKEIVMCGKTGTAQNPHGENHSIFLAFAPKDQPKIALSVFVENGGYGATWAVPIASLLVEKYLTDTITRPWMEETILKANIYR